jgi:hypothetical protein
MLWGDPQSPFAAAEPPLGETTGQPVAGGYDVRRMLWRVSPDRGRRMPKCGDPSAFARHFGWITGKSVGIIPL